MYWCNEPVKINPSLGSFAKKKKKNLNITYYAKSHSFSTGNVNYSNHLVSLEQKVSKTNTLCKKN